MSSREVDLFGDTASAAKIKKPGMFEREIFDYETCWNNCRFLGEMQFVRDHKNPARRGFYLCNHPLQTEMKCFKSDACCELYVRPVKKRPLKPETAGWEDY